MEKIKEKENRLKKKQQELRKVMDEKVSFFFFPLYDLNGFCTIYKTVDLCAFFNNV